MTKAISCGGVVFYRGKVLLLYKNQSGKYLGWVLPKGTLEKGETFMQAALREVREETSSSASVLRFIGKTKYNFKGYEDMVEKTVYWYLMAADSFYCKPQTEEFFADAGFYKQHEAYHLLKFNDEKQILQKAFLQYHDLRNKRVYSHS